MSAVVIMIAVAAVITGIEKTVNVLMKRISKVYEAYAELPVLV